MKQKGPKESVTGLSLHQGSRLRGQEAAAPFNGDARDLKNIWR